MKNVTANAVRTALKIHTLTLLKLPEVIAVGAGLDDRGYYLSINTSGSTCIKLPEALNEVRVVVEQTE